MPLRNETLERFLERLASTDPAPGGGAAAAVATAMAAARLVELNVHQGKLDGDWCDRAAAYVARSAGNQPPTD